MTIKPVAPTQKRVAGADAEKKESQQVTVDVDSKNSHPHRNVVIDHGQGRAEVFDELARHRRSPHKSTRSKRREHHETHHTHHNKRDRAEREKHVNSSTVGNAASVGKCSSPHVHGGLPTDLATTTASSTSAGAGKSPEHLSGIPAVLGCQSPKSQSAVTQAAANLLKAVEETYSGYNSGDEHLQPKEGAITADEWQNRDEQFAKCMTDRGFVLKPVEEDGACLFRSISLQIYGDEEMHDVIRQHTMDYIYKNREYFSHFVTEDINSYIKRKRRKDSHGNHIEIQAMSEIYSRPVEVYCYKATPINIFNSEQLNSLPLRLSYQRGSHYNAIIDPYNATVGVGLGLAGYKPDLQTKEAARLSEQLEIEQTMFEDKLKTTDWEATNEAIEEQIARESYLQWCRENLHKSRASTAASSSATVTSAEAAYDDTKASPSKYSMQRNSNSSATAAASSSLGVATISGITSISSSSQTTTMTTTANTLMLEQSFGMSPKSLNALAYNLKKDTSAHDLGFDSDDTDMSSTSSIGGGGNLSPTATATRCCKKTKKTRGQAVLTNKKRRREHQQAALALSDVAKDIIGGPTVSVRKSPKNDSPLLTATASAVVSLHETRSCTPDGEQQPCTSKQSNTPEKNKNNNTKDATKTATAGSIYASSSTKQPLSSLYQELLEASYATDNDFGQLNDSEMLQQAIRMSTQDYIADQKRKYLYGP